VLLLDSLLDSLLLSALLRVASLSDEQDFLVLLASFFLDTSQLQLALSLSSLKLLVEIVANALALSSLDRRSALPGQAHAVVALTHLVNLRGDDLSLALRSSIKLVSDHLVSDGLLLVLLEALLHRRCGACIPTLNLDLEAHWLRASLVGSCDLHSLYVFSVD